MMVWIHSAQTIKEKHLFIHQCLSLQLSIKHLTETVHNHNKSNKNYLNSSGARQNETSYWLLNHSKVDGVEAMTDGQ